MDRLNHIREQIRDNNSTNPQPTSSPSDTSCPSGKAVYSVESPATDHSKVKQSNNNSLLKDTFSFISTFASVFILENINQFNKRFQPDKYKEDVTFSNSGIMGNTPTTQNTVIKTNLLTKKEVQGFQTFYGEVDEIIDGDSLTVKTAKGTQEIRIYGIDAPEIKQKGGQESKQNLERLLKNKKLHLKKISIDPYNRVVCHINENGKDIGGIQVFSGNAWVAPYVPDTPTKKRYLSLQKKSKNKKLGIWNQINPEAPWNNRSEKKRNSIRNTRPAPEIEI